VFEESVSIHTAGGLHLHHARAQMLRPASEAYSAQAYSAQAMPV
jgi:hypothetical protein